MGIPSGAVLQPVWQAMYQTLNQAQLRVGAVHTDPTSPYGFVYGPVYMAVRGAVDEAVHWTMFGAVHSDVLGVELYIRGLDDTHAEVLATLQGLRGDARR